MLVIEYITGRRRRLYHFQQKAAHHPVKMKIFSLVSAAAILPLVLAKPLSFPYKSVASVTTSSFSADSESADSSSSEESDQAPNRPWQVFSLLKRPFEDQPSISFIFRDPNTKYETKCHAELPMGGYTACEDDSTLFLYGGVSFQYGETWLAISRSEVHVCNEKSVSEDQFQANSTSCEVRGASGTADMSHSFWQQPGWNSWVHPEELELEWGWA